MDGFLIAWLDAIFHAIGKFTVSILNRFGLSTGDWSWGGLVVLGLFVGLLVLSATVGLLKVAFY